MAARLPVLTLGAAAGGTATRIGQLFASGNSLWSFGAAASGTVFDGGALKYRQAAARAALDQAGDQYRGVVLAALQGTADVLQSIDADADALDHAARSARAADRALQIARAQERAGQAGALVRLNAEIAARQAGMGLAQARAARFADTVALYQALGGGWSADTGFQGGGR